MKKEGIQTQHEKLNSYQQDFFNKRLFHRYFSLFFRYKYMTMNRTSINLLFSISNRKEWIALSMVVIYDKTDQ